MRVRRQANEDLTVAIIRDAQGGTTILVGPDVDRRQLRLLVDPLLRPHERAELCYVRPCVRALGHLEPVTHAENNRRSWEHHQQHSGPRLRDSSGRFIRRQS